MSARALDDLDTALAEIERVLEADPCAAETMVRALLREYPTEPRVVLALGSALRRQRKIVAARTILEPLARDVPDMAPAQYELGLVLGMIGENASARVALRRAVDLDPTFAQAWRALGDQLSRMRNRGGADTAYAEHFYAKVKDPRLRDAMTALRENRLSDAEALLQSVIAADPTNVSALKLLSETFIRGKRVLRAESALKRCIELAPDFVAARLRLATLLLTQNKPQETIEQVDEILKLEPDEPQHRDLKAAAYLHMGAFAEAADEYEIMLKLAPNQPAAWMAYGRALRALGRRDAAIAAYRKTIALLPGQGEAYWNLASVRSFRFEPAEVEALKTQLGRDAIYGKNRGLFHLALGRALELEDQFAEAFENYRLGNELVRLELNYDPEETTELVQRSKSLFTPKFFADRAGRGCPSPDPIFVVGLPRSGSTLIEQILASHLAIENTAELRVLPYIAGRLGGKKKPSDAPALYPDVLDTLDADTLKALGEEYLWRARAHRILGRERFVDKMPANFLHVGMLQLILPNAKIVDVRRHPLACCVSNFKQHYESIQKFAYSLGNLGQYYFDYVELMAHYDAVLPGKVHRVLYEDLVRDPQAEVKRLLDYLGLPFEDACLRFYENDRLVRSPSADQVKMPIFTDALDQWRNYEPWLGPLKTALGFVLESYPEAPKFYSRVRAKLEYSTAWQGAGQSWLVEANRAGTGIAE